MSLEELKGWFRRRRISYFHEEERGIIYLLFCSSDCHLMGEFLEGSSGFRSAVEENEYGDLQGMLFMFSVCHVIIYIQEGSRLDTQILKKFRVLQTAKHAMAPYLKSQTSSLSASRSSSSPSRNSPSGPYRSPGRSGGIMRRNGSSISFMSGLGSHASLFPGQCTPALLFIFLDDFSDFTSTSSTEESANTSPLCQSSSSNLAIPNTSKGSGPGPGPGQVVVLARPASKSEGGLRKKLQSSLEAQIRFSIKKCRTLTGSDAGHASSRGGGLSNSAPLFSLDASKAVALLDRYSNQRGESLNFATSLVECVLNGKATSDSLLLESHSQSSMKEDILSVREFIYKQADCLRGRGGLVSNTSCGSVGMVAVAAAAAAAASSAISGKALTAPELPGMDTWLSSSRQILQGILSAKPGCLVENDVGNRNTRQRFVVKPSFDGNVRRLSDPLDIAASWLESVNGLNDKFSTSWCQKALPAAKDIYLNELPACYPTSMHMIHMEKALHAFRSMVKGPAVELFVKKLEDECTAIWTCGRQLCDFISLTGKPCMHQRHGVASDGEFSDDGMVKPHSSGLVFLQACACGRSRELLSDPFDFGAANITSKCFEKCCKLLPELQLPQIKNSGPVQASSWSLIRVGEAKYYEPSKGLLQSGFCSPQKFLLKWKVFLEKSKDHTDILSTVERPDSVSSISSELLDKPIAGSIEKKPDPSEFIEPLPNGKQTDKKSQTDTSLSNDRKINLGRGVPNFTLKKPFSEVVAGSAIAVSKFPPLQSRKQSSGGWPKGTNQSSTSGSTVERVPQSPAEQDSKQYEDGRTNQKSVKENGIGVDKYTDSGPFPELSSNHASIKVKSGEKINLNSRHINVYIGFEHECPCGHRFILTPEHLNKLGPLYSLPEESQIPLCGESLDNERQGKFGNDSRHGKPRHTSNGNTFAGRRVRNQNKTREISGKGNTYLDRAMHVRGAGQVHKIPGESEESDSVKDLKESLHSLHLDDDALSMLNRNLPIYMNCPHCRTSKNAKEPAEANFAGSISQLRRMFVVTPPFPVVLATCPVVQFEESCLPSFIPDRDKKLQFSFECPIILPPESFLSLKLPFIYGVQLEDGSVQSLRPFDHQPELTAWVNKGTILLTVSKEASV